MNAFYYLDNAATTRVLEAATGVMLQVMRDIYGNPSSLHAFGLRAEKVLKQCRQIIAESIGAHPSAVIFTSGATEANNWALEAIYRLRRKRGQTILCTPCSHASCRTIANRGT